MGYRVKGTKKRGQEWEDEKIMDKKKGFLFLFPPPGSRRYV